LAFVLLSLENISGDALMTLSETDRALLKMELRQAFSARRVPLFASLAVLAVFVIVQQSELPPTIVIVLVVLAGLESQYTNIFFRSPHELEALSMFPVRWERIVFIKNIATVVVTVMAWMMIAMATLYFSPKHLRLADVGNALLYGSTIIFPLLHIGNIESLRSPRRTSSWSIDDLVQAGGMLLFVLVLSLPYLLLVSLLNLPLACIAYVGLTAVHWYARSVPMTAARILQQRIHLCATP
jgi:hypothetical protein